MADKMKYKYNLINDGTPMFSLEEILKGPQIFFVNKGEREYLKIIAQKFNNNCKPNDSHDYIYVERIIEVR